MRWRRCGAPTWTRTCRPPPSSSSKSRPLAELRLLAIGKLGSGPEADLFARYAARLRPRLSVTELPDGRGSPVEIKRREADALLAALAPNARAVALDLGGPSPSSEAFAASLAIWLADSRPVTFLIGGAEGFDARVLTRADHTISLGAMTWPHLLVRTMLAEQLWRAQAISSGHPYHRAGRP